ncbi:MAG: hydrogenase maturation nickel metallochaperone HypA [Hydrogenothermaceae bacterium]
MHEFSIVQSLLELIEKNVKENNGKAVSKVVVEIGKMSGVEPHLLEVAFNTFKENTVAHNAEFVVEIQEVMCLCKSCNKQFIVENYDFLCPFCQSLDFYVIKGRDMFLKSLEIEV